MPPALLQDELFASRFAPLDGLAFFSSAPADWRGAVHTRPEVANFILDLAGWSGDHDLTRGRLLEPSAGEGDFLLPAVARLLAQAKPRQAKDLVSCIRAVEVNIHALETCRRRLTGLFRDHGWAPAVADTLITQWLVHADFLTVPINTTFSHVVGNPPYVRLEDLPKELLGLYRSRWPSLYDRADLYVAFIERSLDLLEPEGRLGFICADRWMKNRYGGPLRLKVAGGFTLDVYVDFTGCPAFFDEVDAYPAVSIIRRGRGDSTRVAFRPDISEASLTPLAAAIMGRSESKSVKTLSHVVHEDQPWRFNEDGTKDIINQLECRFPLLEAAGCSVGIGVATGADGIFIGDEATLAVEPSRRLPLVMTRDIRSGEVKWGGKWVLNPFEDNGGLVELNRYPKLKAYVETHRAAILRRNVASRNPGGWYRTIDRIHSDLTRRPKLLIPDIKGDAHVVYEPGNLYPHHNLYYVVSDTWNLHALRAVLSSRVARAFVAAYCPRMRGGFLRFQAQYLRRIRLPLWDSLDREIQSALVQQGRMTCPNPDDESVRSVYGLNQAEWEILSPRPH